MSFKYYHDAGRKIVYRMPAAPTVIENKDRKGNRIGWIVQSEIEVTRADNAIEPKTQDWKYSTREYPQERYSAGDSREAAAESFQTEHAPRCQEIDAATYETLRAKYEQEARQNKEA